MSEIAEIVDTLEGRIGKLFSKIDTLEQNNHILKSELSESATIIKKQSDVSLHRITYIS